MNETKLYTIDFTERKLVKVETVEHPIEQKNIEPTNQLEQNVKRIKTRRKSKRVDVRNGAINE